MAALGYDTKDREITPIVAFCTCAFITINLSSTV